MITRRIPRNTFMARAASQTQPVQPYALPADFTDDLAARAFPHRFRKIGSPYDYLNAIGIGPIIEFISKGHLLIEVAEATNVPLRILRMWVEQEGYFQDVENAETESAEGLLAYARSMVKNAPTEFELRRAKVMLAHAEGMASKKNKLLYGEAVKDKGGAKAVQYVFNINGNQLPQAIQAAQIIESTAEHVEIPVKVAFDPYAMIEVDPRAPTVIMEDGEELRLVAARPVKPTADNPDIGPFYIEADRV